MAWDYEPVAGPYKFTEGPVWEPDDGMVYFTDISNNRIYRYDPAPDAAEERVDTTNRGNGLELGA